MKNSILTLDVRDDIRSGREPFKKIMAAVGQLEAGQELLLVAPFEPVPLFAVLAKLGFTHNARKTPDGDWEATFKRENALKPAPASPESSAASGCGCNPARQKVVVELDARGLEPPQPLIRILEALASLPVGGELQAQTDRRPIHLFSQLDERGFTGQTEETKSGSFITHISRR